MTWVALDPLTNPESVLKLCKHQIDSMTANRFLAISRGHPRILSILYSSLLLNPKNICSPSMLQNVTHVLDTLKYEFDCGSFISSEELLFILYCAITEKEIYFDNTNIFAGSGLTWRDLFETGVLGNHWNSKPQKIKLNYLLLSHYINNVIKIEEAILWFKFLKMLISPRNLDLQYTGQESWELGIIYDCFRNNIFCSISENQKLYPSVISQDEMGKLLTVKHFYGGIDDLPPTLLNHQIVLRPIDLLFSEKEIDWNVVNDSNKWYIWSHATGDSGFRWCITSNTKILLMYNCTHLNIKNMTVLHIDYYRGSFLI